MTDLLTILVTAWTAVVGVALGYVLRPEMDAWARRRRMKRLARATGYDDFWEYIAAEWDNDYDYDGKESERE